MHLTALIEYLTATVALAWRTRPFNRLLLRSLVKRVGRTRLAFTGLLMYLKTMLPVHYPTTDYTRPQVVSVLMIKVS